MKLTLMVGRVLLPLLLATHGINAQEEDLDYLTVEPYIAGINEKSFVNEKNIQPKVSDFEVLNAVLMSNKQGDRWVAVTLSNNSAGTRILETDHIYGLFADGERRSPLGFKQSFDGKEVRSMTLSFGYSKFPLLSVYTRN